MERITDNESLINLYLEDMQCKLLIKRTVENYKSCLKIFSKIIVKPLTEVDTKDLRGFLLILKNKKNRNNNDYSFSTISRYFTAIDSFYEFLEMEGYIEKNYMKQFRKRYLSSLNKKRYANGGSKRKLISIEEMSMMVNSIIDPRDKAVLVLLCKTGIRRNELINIDVDDINWTEQYIRLKPTPKRSNSDVFFDDECARTLKRWLVSRDHRINNGNKALFINERGGRLNRNGIYSLVTNYATKIGFHNPTGEIKDRFTPHCCRHWFTTHLRRNGMPREFIQELRGDARHEAIDIYHHIDRKELQDSYLACIPQLGID